jgi:hypothetical protein
MACLLLNTEAIRFARSEKEATIETIPTAGRDRPFQRSGLTNCLPDTRYEFVLRMRGLNDDGRRKKAQAKSESFF